MTEERDWGFFTRLGDGSLNFSPSVEEAQAIWDALGGYFYPGMHIRVWKAGLSRKTSAPMNEDFIPMGEPTIYQVSTSLAPFISTKNEAEKIDDLKGKLVNLKAELAKVEKERDGWRYAAEIGPK